MTLIQGFRLEDITLQIEMNTRLRERVNRNTVSLPSTLMYNVCNTDDEGPSLYFSCYLSLSLSLYISSYLCILQVDVFMPFNSLCSISSKLLGVNNAKSCGTLHTDV